MLENNDPILPTTAPGESAMRRFSWEELRARFSAAQQLRQILNAEALASAGSSPGMFSVENANRSLALSDRQHPVNLNVSANGKTIDGKPLAVTANPLAPHRGQE